MMRPLLCKYYVLHLCSISTVQTCMQVNVLYHSSNTKMLSYAVGQPGVPQHVSLISSLKDSRNIQDDHSSTCGG